jgi:hypothetical protein
MAMIKTKELLKKMLGWLGLLCYVFFGAHTVLAFIDKSYWPLVALFFLGTSFSAISSIGGEGTNTPISLLKPKAWLVALYL